MPAPAPARLRLLVASLAVGLLVVAGCSSGGSDAGSDTTVTTAVLGGATAETTTPAATGAGVEATCKALDEVTKLTNSQSTTDVDTRRSQLQQLRDLVQDAEDAAPDAVADDFGSIGSYIDQTIAATKSAKTVAEFEAAGAKIDPAKFQDASTSITTWQKANCD